MKLVGIREGEQDSHAESASEVCLKATANRVISNLEGSLHHETDVSMILLHIQTFLL